MSSPRLLVALRPREELRKVIAERLPTIEWGYAREVLPSRADSVEAMLIGSVERELGDADLRTLPRLRFVQRVYTGMDGVPFDRFPPSVRFAGNVGAYAPFVSEHAVALALGAARELPRAYAQAQSGMLRPPPAQRLLWGRTAVILGYGEIGRAIAERLSGFGARVLGLNRTGRMMPGCSGMYPADRLIDAVREGDFVFEVRPLTRQTRGTIDGSVFAAMKPAAVFINVGRAGTVQEEALYQHLVEHPEFRAALDVWWHEDFAGGKLDLRLPFAKLTNFVGTPHCAGFGPGVEEYVVRKAIANLERFFAGEEPRYVIDPADYAGLEHSD
ncbi:MAG TPA: NAD(P)-dependent oxidoreductase [Thermoplasmata archaeon]|nr:NAD(P)-dependent oxidoreductase [Thermoplasmata archaeon]